MVKNNPFRLPREGYSPQHSPHTKLFVLTLLLTALLLGLSGCVTLADPEASQVYNSDSVGTLDAQSTLGQTFVSRRPHLNGITIWLTPPPPSPSNITKSIIQTITVKLFHSPADTTPVFSTTLTTPTNGSYVPFTISMPGQGNPAGQVFYLLMTVNSGSLQVNGRNEDAYPDGQAYLNGQPVDTDIAFRATYNYTAAAVLQDLGQYARNSWLIVPLLILVWLPGWLLIDISGLRQHFDFGQQTAISVGLSLALVPVVMLWTTVLKLKWSGREVSIAAVVLLVIFIARLIYRWITARNKLPDPSNELSLPPPASPKNTLQRRHLPTVALMVIFLVSLLIRFIMVRDLATPAWVDSVHHALITRLIMTNGGFPSTYLPYLDISPTAYHPGFHSLAAAFTWLSGLQLDRSLLILGQFLNALCIFAVYLLATSLTRSSTAGVVAAFVTGFITPMPAYYTSWGRYTELTGLLVLPVALALLQLGLDEKNQKLRPWIILFGAISLAGLFMIHYRVIAFVVCLLLAYLVFRFAIKSYRPATGFKHTMLVILIMAFASLLLVLPWFIPTLKAILLPRLGIPAAQAAIAPFQDFSWPYLTSALGKQALAVAGLGLLWAVIKKQLFAFILLAWVLLMFILANLDVLKLPGAGLITNLSVEIILFIPLSILAGYFIAQLYATWQELFSVGSNLTLLVIVSLFLLLAGYLGSKQLVAILNSITLLSRQADLPAIQWVDQNIPVDETIVLNPFAWGYGIYAGNDGGYWISPLSGRQTLPPPVLYGLGSTAKGISQQAEQIIALSSNPAALRNYFLSLQLHYIFTGERGGVIPPGKLASSGLFDVLYHQNGVWILAVKP